MAARVTPDAPRYQRSSIQAVFEGVTTSTDGSWLRSAWRRSRARTTARALEPSWKAPGEVHRTLVTVLSSTPLNPFEGSGTFVGVQGLVEGLRRLGHQVEIRPLVRRSGFHTLDRWRYNGQLVRHPPAGTDLVVGVYLDGFRWARRRRVPFVVSLKGIIADELRNERGWVRLLLGVQARGTGELRAGRPGRGDRRYQAAVAEAAYGVSPGLSPWSRADRSGGVARRPRVPPPSADGSNGAFVARMYARKRMAISAGGGLLREGIPACSVAS